MHLKTSARLAKIGLYSPNVFLCTIKNLKRFRASMMKISIDSEARMKKFCGI